ncbi:MAG: hypothetical protein ACREBE_18900, partial [bacterium]
DREQGSEELASMSTPPSIKATGFQGAADDLRVHVDSGRLPRAELAARLEPEDLRYLDKPLAASTWVPIASYRRVVELLIELEADGAPEPYLHGRGVRSAERLHKIGLYRQFEASVDTWGARVGKIATTMASVIYNFTRWTFESGEAHGDFKIFVDDARDFPEIARFTTQGFIEYTSKVVSGGDVRVRSERPTPERVVYLGRKSR